MKISYLLIITFLTLTTALQGQNNVGIGTTTPDNSAILDLSSNSKGLLIPRMSDIDRFTQVTQLILAFL